MQVLFTPHAREQLRHLHRFIAAKSYPSRADAYIKRMVDFCEALATFPHRGTLREDLEPGLRTIGFERRVTIAFFVEEEAVYIAGVFYGGRDYEADFATDPGDPIE